MKITKTASGKQTLKMSKSEWLELGKKAGWMKIARDYPGAGDIGGYPGIPYSEYEGEDEEVDTVPDLDPDAVTDELKEKDIQATMAQMRKGLTFEQIDTILAKDIVDAKNKKNENVNDYDFNKEEDLREWATWVNYWDHVKHQFTGTI